MRECKDCVRAGITTRRAAENPGPRCATHWRMKRRRDGQRAHALYVARTYNLSIVAYWVMYDRQGGRCAICARATGATRMLSVDHDHRCCPGSTSCGACVRGLLCRPCNTMLGRMADAVAVFESAAMYLRAWDWERERAVA